MSLKASPTFALLALFLSLGLAFAFYVQFYMGIDACQLCYTQRYLSIFAIIICLISAVIVKHFQFVKYLVLISIFLNLVHSAYHVGVEQKWWNGPSSCVTSAITINTNELSEDEAIEQLKKQLENKKVVPCDKITWRIFGVPATILNTLFLLGLFILSLAVCISCQRKAYNHLFYK